MGLDLSPVLALLAVSVAGILAFNIVERRERYPMVEYSFFRSRSFLGANGISPARGLTTPDPAEAAVKRLMIGCARRGIVLSDHSKIGQVSTHKYGDLAEVDLLITDTGITGTDEKALRTAGLTLEKT